MMKPNMRKSFFFYDKITASASVEVLNFFLFLYYFLVSKRRLKVESHGIHLINDHHQQNENQGMPSIRSVLFICLERC